MKTSNKLFTLLLIALFSLPVILIKSLKAAVKNNQYVVKTWNGKEEATAIALKPFNVIKLETNDVGQNLLTCNIKYGETNSYKWTNYSQTEHGDVSTLVSYKGDTLIVSYQPKRKQSGEREYYLVGAALDLTLNKDVPVIAQATTITVNTLNGGYTGLINFDLSKNAELNIITVLDHRPEMKDTLTETNRTIIPYYSIKSNNSKVNIDAHIRLVKLNIDAENNSTVSIGKNVLIDSVNAKIAQETIVNAPYSFVKHLK